MSQHGKYTRLVEAAQQFLRKVETGKARSVESYNALKKALEGIEAEERLEGSNSFHCPRAETTDPKPIKPSYGPSC